MRELVVTDRAKQEIESIVGEVFFHFVGRLVTVQRSVSKTRRASPD